MSGRCEHRVDFYDCWECNNQDLKKAKDEVEELRAELPDDYRDSKDWRSLPPVDRIRLLKEWHRDAKDGERMAWEAAAHHKDALDEAVGLLGRCLGQLNVLLRDPGNDADVTDARAFLAKHDKAGGD